MNWGIDSATGMINIKGRSIARRHQFSIILLLDKEDSKSTSRILKEQFLLSVQSMMLQQDLDDVFFLPLSTQAYDEFLQLQNYLEGITYDDSSDDSWQSGVPSILLGVSMLMFSRRWMPTLASE